MYVQNGMARSYPIICADLFTHTRGCSISDHCEDNQILDSCDIIKSTNGQKKYFFLLKKHTLFNVSLIKVQLTA